jgi:hypothetical protein
MQNWGGRIFSNRQLGIRLYIRIVKIMMLEEYTSPHQKTWTSTDETIHRLITY